MAKSFVTQLGTTARSRWRAIVAAAAGRSAQRASAPAQRAPGGRVYLPDTQLDALREYVTDSPTFARIKNLIRAGDAGDLATTLTLFKELEEKDEHVMAVANTRRLALTGLDWEVVSAAEGQEDAVDKGLADDAADYVRETFTNLESLDVALEHLATAIGPNLAVAELVWQSNELVELVPIPAHRLTQQPSESMAVRIVTRTEPLGIPATPDKFVVHRPQSLSGWIFERAISRAQAFLWLVKHLAIADWVTFCELFGMPVRIGKYEPSATTEEKTQLVDMLTNMGTKAWAMVSSAVQIELVETTQRGTAPYKELAEYCDRKASILWLGGNLTSDTTGGTGTYAAGAVQNEVREDIRDDDVKRESRTVRSQIVAPLCRFRFPNHSPAPVPAVQGAKGARDQGAKRFPLPIFRRQIPEVEDLVQTADLLIKGTQQLGLKVPRKWVHEKLGLPEAKEGEAVVEVVNPNPFAEEGPL